MMKLPVIKKELQKLTLDELQEVNIWLQRLLQDAELSATELSERGSVKKGDREDVRDDKTYRLEYIRCGKEECKCTSGDLHGPYWYAYWNENGKTKSRYIGKKLPKSQS
jgi:hypothetical protein